MAGALSLEWTRAGRGGTRCRAEERGARNHDGEAEESIPDLMLEDGSGE